MKQKNIKVPASTQKGFTLIETMIAVLILTATLSGFFAVVANSLFSARYANNEITANYLIQEALDSIRNDRDTVAFQNADPVDPNLGWSNFKLKYSSCFDSIGPSARGGCYFEPADVNSLPQVCDVDPRNNFGVLNCPVLNYDEKTQGYGFYTYHDLGITGNFKRKVVMSDNPNRSDQLDIRVTVEWLNGSVVRTRSMVVSLLNWKR